MKTEFLMKIFNPPNVKFETMDKIFEQARHSGYTMVSFNEIVYSVSDGIKLFDLKDLV